MRSLFAPDLVLEPPAGSCSAGPLVPSDNRAGPIALRVGGRSVGLVSTARRAAGQPLVTLRQELERQGLRWGVVVDGPQTWLVERERSRGGLTAERFGPEGRSPAALQPTAFLPGGTLEQALQRSDELATERWSARLAAAREMARADGLAAAVETLLAQAAGDWPPPAAGPLGVAYQQLLAESHGSAGRTQRAESGSFYTPPEVVRLLVDEALPLNGQGMTRVLDPAVGAGVFLEAARDHLAEACLSRTSCDDWLTATAQAHQRVCRECLYGVDVDPLAARLVHAAVGADVHVGSGDALLGRTWTGRHRREPRAADWPGLLVAAGLAAEAPTTAAGFDAVLGNPPYLSVKRGQLKPLSDRLRRRFSLARGQWDAYMLFVELALDLLRDGGRLGFVLPRPMLVNEQATALRRHLLSLATPSRVVDLGRAFDAAEVETIALSAQRGGVSQTVRLERLEPDGTLRAEGRIPLFHVRHDPAARLPLGTAERDLEVLDRLDRATRRLGDVADITRGLEIGKRHPAVLATPSAGVVPLLRGQDVTRYEASPATWLRPDELSEHERKDPALFDQRPKLLVRRVANRPIAALDTAGAWVLNTLYVIRLNEPGLDPAWLLAVLNSEPAAYWLQKTYGGDERLFPYLRQNQLLALPLPSPDADLGVLAREMTRRPDPALQARINAVVAKGYGLGRGWAA